MFAYFTVSLPYYYNKHLLDHYHSINYLFMQNRQGTFRQSTQALVSNTALKSFFHRWDFTSLQSLEIADGSINVTLPNLHYEGM